MSTLIFNQDPTLAANSNHIIAFKLDLEGENFLIKADSLENTLTIYRGSNYQIVLERKGSLDDALALIPPMLGKRVEEVVFNFSLKRASLS